MRYQIWQNIELMVYFFSNGTINMKKSKNYETDYRDIVIANPKLYSLFGNMLIDKMNNDGSLILLRDEVIELIYNYEPTDPVEEDILTEDDFYTVAKRFFNYIAFDISKNKKWFTGLMKYANDIQLVFCVWGNNLKFDEEYKVLNEEEAKIRATEFMKSIFDMKKPLKKFEDWEFLHHT